MCVCVCVCVRAYIHTWIYENVKLSCGVQMLVSDVRESLT